MAVGANALSGIPAGSRAYLDTNVWIYALEGFESFAQPLLELFARIDNEEITALTSELSLAETLVKPLQSANPELERIYIDAIQSSGSLIVVPVSRDVLIAAARLRARHVALKLPDAIHAATALAQVAQFFVTNDARFGSITELNTIVLHAT